MAIFALTKYARAFLRGFSYRGTRSWCLNRSTGLSVVSKTIGRHRAEPDTLGTF